MKQLIIIPNSVINIDSYTFGDIHRSVTIDYNETKDEWDIIEFREYWNLLCSDIIVHCTDGDITIPPNN